MLPKTPVYFRADGNSRIGLGHIHRLLALCGLLKNNFECKFIIGSPLPGVQGLIHDNCGEIIDLEKLTLQHKEISHFLTGKEIVVLDGYDFDTAYQQSIKQKGSILVCVDDLHQHHFVSDIIINPAGGVSEVLYSRESWTKLFLGPEFSLLKKPFLEATKKRQRNDAGNSIFICMGGADPDNHTLSTLKRLLNFPFHSYQVVVGEAYMHRDSLEKEACVPDRNIEIRSNLESEMMVNVMKECAVAVCSASGIAYEYLSVGGELYIQQTATNQSDLFHYLLSSKLAFDFKDFRVNESLARQSVQKQAEVFDGLSGERILKIFNRLDFDFNTRIRRAQMSDLMTVFNWVNDSELRAQSYNPAPIGLDDHSQWFNKKIADPSAFLYIIEYKRMPIGQVRFDVDLEATISYSLDKLCRGRGWGQNILEKAISKFRNDNKESINIVGYVKRGNTSSNIIFKNLKFDQHLSHEYPDSYKYELIKL